MQARCSNRWLNPCLKACHVRNADVEVTRLLSDRTRHSFMISSLQQGTAPRGTHHAVLPAVAQQMPRCHAARRRNVLYFYLRDRDLDAAAVELDRLIVLLRDGATPFAGASSKQQRSRCCW